jgi:hypothetical protein
MTLSRCLLSCGELDWLLDFVPGDTHAFVELDRRIPVTAETCFHRIVDSQS